MTISSRKGDVVMVESWELGRDVEGCGLEEVVSRIVEGVQPILMM
jgi:hypothetical protein